MSQSSEPQSPPVRLDKWLWAARFFKTRTLAAEAIAAGHVQLNGERAKPARQVKPGDQLRVRTAGDEFDVRVLALSERRGPASEAQGLFAESAASSAARAARKAEQALAPVFDHPQVRGRPTKKWRRQLHYFERNNDD